MKLIRIIVIAGLIMNLLLLGREGAFASELVKVAILDSGSNIAYKEGISLIDGTIRDYNGHGTLMAKIVKERYPMAELYIIKVIGKGWPADKPRGSNLRVRMGDIQRR